MARFSHRKLPKYRKKSKIDFRKHSPKFKKRMIRKSDPALFELIFR